MLKRYVLALFALLLASLAPATASNIPAAVPTVSTVAVLRAQGVAAGSSGQAPVVYLEGYSANADGGQGLLYWNSSSTATDDGCIVFQPTGLTTGRYIRPVGSVVDLSWCGLSTADSGTTNLARIQAAANYAASVGASVVAHAYSAAIPVKTELVWPANTDFDAGGLTLQGISGGSIPDLAIFYLGGTPTDLGLLSGDVAKYATSITLASAPPAGVGIGSTIMLVDQTPGSFNTARPYYYNGEYATVQSVSGTTVTLTAGLRYPYPAASTVVTWVQLATARISNLNVHGISAVAGSYPIRIQMAGNGATASNICGDTAKAGGIALYYTYNFYGSNFCALNVNSTGTTENYGDVLVNVNNTTISGGSAVGPRHGVTMTSDGGGTGYSITNHACIVTGMYIGTIQKSDFTTAVPAADMHGDTDGCAYRNNYIDGGAQLAGARNVYQGNTINAGPCRGFSQYAMNLSEVESFDNQFVDNRVNWCGYSANAGYGTLFDCGTGSGFGVSRFTTEPGTLSISRNIFAFYVASGGVSTTNPTFQGSCKNAGSGVVGNLDLTRNTWTMTGEDSGTQGAQGIVVNVGTNSITSLTWSGGTATATVPATPPIGAFFRTGSTQTLTIAGATPTGYNGTYTVTITSPTTFTYAIGDPGGTPATGTLTWRSNWGKVDISNNTGNVAFSIQDVATVVANDVTSDALPTCANCSFGPPVGTATSNVDAIKVAGFTKAVTIGNFTGLGGPEYAINITNSATPTFSTGDLNINGAFTLCSQTGAATCDNTGTGLYGSNPTTVDANGYGINVNAGASAGNGPRTSIFAYQLYGTKGGTIRVSNLARNLTLGAGSAVTLTLAPTLGNIGTVTLNGATPVTVTNANVTASSAVSFTLKTVGGTVGAAPAIQTITAGTGFTVAGTALDTSTYNYTITH